MLIEVPGCVGAPRVQVARLLEPRVLVVVAVLRHVVPASGKVIYKGVSLAGLANISQKPPFYFTIPLFISSL